VRRYQPHNAKPSPSLEALILGDKQLPQQGVVILSVWGDESKTKRGSAQHEAIWLEKCLMPGGSLYLVPANPFNRGINNWPQCQAIIHNIDAL
jgi:hypothetical protein